MIVLVPFKSEGIFNVGGLSSHVLKVMVVGVKEWNSEKVCKLA